MGKIIALVLAAGFSRRMKRNKMLLPFSQGTVIENTVRSFPSTRCRGGCSCGVSAG